LHVGLVLTAGLVAFAGVPPTLHVGLVLTAGLVAFAGVPPTLHVGLVWRCSVGSRAGRQRVVTTAPLARGSISLRLYPHDLDPPETVAEIAAQSALAEDAGFDGVMTQEHHGGFPNYLPNPLLTATWALESSRSLWAAPCPILLPLRAWTQVVEDLAWTSHRFPGRVGCGAGVGAFPLDFEMAGVPFEEMRQRFAAALPEFAAALTGQGRGPIADDPGVAALSHAPIPLIVAAQGPLAVKRAARLGLGLIYDSLQTLERTRDLSDIHAQEGGTGTRILIRRVWLGEPPLEAIMAQMSRFRAVGPAGLQEHWDPNGGCVSARDGRELAEQLHDLMTRGGCHAVNLRVFQAGLSPNDVRDQIGLLGRETLPHLRKLIDASL
jgi:alkanesulfonate monooxygenase SsuD/methylene tetrahydromethanopterin reductase-like flavin-dependent oxidoreductase (luciferase family)